jgi:hypothetical protein
MNGFLMSRQWLGDAAGLPEAETTPQGTWHAGQDGLHGKRSGLPSFGPRTTARFRLSLGTGVWIVARAEVLFRKGLGHGFGELLAVIGLSDEPRLSRVG